MVFLQQTAFVLSLLTAIAFVIGYCVAESPKVAPKAKARVGVLLASLFLASLVFLALFAIAGAVLKRNALYLALLLYVLVPFAIGRLASYRTLKFYTVVQILTLLFTAVTLCAI